MLITDPQTSRKQKIIVSAHFILGSISRPPYSELTSVIFDYKFRCAPKNDVPKNINQPIVQEVLKPTKIYVKELIELNKRVKIKAVVHITGDAYLKFGNLSRFSQGIGFRFKNFNPQPIFSLIQDTAKDLGYTLTDEEMFKTFNMGWGFAIIVDKKDKDRALSILEDSNSKASEIGEITDTNKIEILYKNKKLVLG